MRTRSGTRPRIHGELLKLRFEVVQSSIAKYMVKRLGHPSQGWGHLLRNHAPNIAAMGLFVVPCLGFDLLYALVIVRLDRRDLVWISITTTSTAEWVAQQITEAFPCNEAPSYLIRDQDGIYGVAVTRRLRAMGIQDRPIACGSTMAERHSRADDRIDPARMLDHVIVLGESHLRRILRAYGDYYNEIRTHRSLEKIHRFRVPFSGLDRSGHIRSLAV